MLFHANRRSACGGTALFVSTALAGGLLSSAGLAQTAIPLAPITVATAPDMTCPLDSGAVEKPQIDARTVLGATDTAALLSGLPGVALANNGGFSSLPILHGMADDRVKTLVDGMPITSACPNHMNPALSYIAPSRTAHLSAVAGITPVSAGGDSIGGSISVAPAQPLFAGEGEEYVTHGMATTFFHSNNHQIGVNGDVTAATDAVSLGYDGSWTRARVGHDGDGERILNSQFETESHHATFGLRQDDQLLTLRAGHQLTPYEGFPNAYMDLTGNTSNYLNAAYDGGFDWGSLQARVYWQNARHEMDFLPGRNTTGHMPMDTDGTDIGYDIRIELPLTRDDTLRLGNAYHGYRLRDWWPPISSRPNGMMSPNTFINLDEGTRRQVGTFAEWERHWDDQWSSLIGLRNDVILMDTGNVAGYSNNMMAMYATDAAAFNSQPHAKTDVNYDMTATTRFEASSLNTWEFGLARKNRSPNLYERYAWSTGGMAASMIGWFGNGAEYVGNLSLRPETANTVSISTGWHDAKKVDWAITATPYYTYVQNYIGVDRLGGAMTPGVNLLQFANHDAELFGFDLAGTKSLAKGGDWGDFDLTATAGWVKGLQINTGNRLYHMQPLNARISLDHHLGGWSSTAEVRLVNDKSVTNPLENEPTTAGFALINWRTAYQLDNITVAVGIDNLLNKQYYDPNGGVYLSYWRATNTAQPMGPLPAPGRSFNAGLTVAF